MECQNPMCRYGKDENCMNPKHYVKRAIKKPVTIEFVEWTGENLKEIIMFTGRHETASGWSWEKFEEVVAESGLKIFTLEGHHMATIGDLIIKGVHGEFYPCKPDIFAKTYDVVGA